jgi:TRAP-type mannitol/chloroaromatic compound transport system substrate-binding protein
VLQTRIKLSNEVYQKYKTFTMNQNQTLSPTFGTPKVGRNLGSTIYNANRVILQMIKDMAKGNVNIDHFKSVMLKNGIQSICILG